MNVYATEEEQIESIKKWWKENGRSIIAGAVFGLGGILAWQAWTGHQTDVGEQASVHFEQLMDALQAGRSDFTNTKAEVLMTDFKSSSYALFGALSDARAKLEQKDVAAARARLEWIMANTSDDALLEITRLRLARILLSEADLDGAAKLAGERTLASYAGEYAELEGDIAATRDDIAAAAAAYRRALEKGVSNAATVQMKLDDLAVETGAPASSS